MEIEIISNKTKTDKTNERLFECSVNNMILNVIEQSRIKHYLMVLMVGI